MSKSEYLSIQEDIKQIAENLIEDSQIKEVIQVRYYEDKYYGEPCVFYKRFDSIALMESVGLLTIIQKINNSYLRNAWSGDTTVIEYPIYLVKINLNQINKFLKNPNINLYLNEDTSHFKYKSDDVIAQENKLLIVNSTNNTIVLYYEGLKPSNNISKKTPWFKVFQDFVKHKTLKKNEMLAIWNNTGKGKFINPRKTKNVSYAPKIRQLVLDGVKRASLDISRHIKIKKSSGFHKNCYVLEID